MLSSARIAGADGSDFSSRPGLPGDPFDNVVAVPAVIQNQTPDAFGMIAAANIIHHDRITSGSKPLSLPDVSRRLLVVRRAAQNRGELAGKGSAASCGQVNIQCQADAVSHRNHNILLG